MMVCSYFGAHHRPVGVNDPPLPGSDPVRAISRGDPHGTPEAMLAEILRLREEIGLDYLYRRPAEPQPRIADRKDRAAACRK